MTTINLDHTLETNLAPGYFVDKTLDPVYQQTTQIPTISYQTLQTYRATRFPVTQQTTRLPVTQKQVPNRTPENTGDVSADFNCGMRAFKKPVAKSLIFKGKPVVRGQFPW